MGARPWLAVRKTLGVAPVVGATLSNAPLLRVERYFFQARQQQLPGLDCPTLLVHLGGAPVSGGDLERPQGGLIPSIAVAVPAGTASSWFLEGAVDVAVLYVDDAGGPRQRRLAELLVRAGRLQPFRDALVGAAMAQLVAELGNGRRADLAFARRLAGVVVDQLLRVLLRQTGRHASPERRHLGRLHAVLAWIDTHLAEPVCNARLAALVGLRESQFRQLFSAAMGVPPSRYMRGRRLARANELLATTNLPIAHISALCGLGGQSHMTTCFKAEYGMTPARWRHMSPLGQGLAQGVRRPATKR